jgi:hypothetical protein
VRREKVSHAGRGVQALFRDGPTNGVPSRTIRTTSVTVVGRSRGQELEGRGEINLRLTCFELLAQFGECNQCRARFPGPGGNDKWDVAVLLRAIDQRLSQKRLVFRTMTWSGNVTSSSSAAAEPVGVTSAGLPMGQLIHCKMQLHF